MHPLSPCYFLGSGGHRTYDPDWIGALHPTNYTSKISALYHALKLVEDTDGTSSIPICRRINLITDSEYCERHFCNNSIKARCNKSIIQRVRPLLYEVRADLDIAISCVTPGSRPTRVTQPWKPWAMQQWINCWPEDVGSSSACGGPLLRSPRTRRPSNSYPSDPPRHKRNLSRCSDRDPRVLVIVIHYLSSAHHAALLRIATSCRNCSRSIPVLPEAFGDLVEHF